MFYFVCDYRYIGRVILIFCLFVQFMYFNVYLYILVVCILSICYLWFFVQDRENFFYDNYIDFDQEGNK